MMSNTKDDEELKLKKENFSKLKFYELAKSSISSRIYSVTGFKISQKRLILSFIVTLLRDFVMAFSVRGGIKLIPKLLKIFKDFHINFR